MQSYKQIILSALEKVVSEHGYQGTVQNRDIHEQALAHRLALHLENSGTFTGYHIDCEYNRCDEAPKTDAEGLNFRPDIIVHIRGSKNNNLIMIETKKFNDSKEEIQMSQQALKKRSRDYGYKHSFVVVFPQMEATAESIIEVKKC